MYPRYQLQGFLLKYLSLSIYGLGMPAIFQLFGVNNDWYMDDAGNTFLAFLVLAVLFFYPFVIVYFIRTRESYIESTKRYDLRETFGPVFFDYKPDMRWFVLAKWGYYAIHAIIIGAFSFQSTGERGQEM